MATPAALRRSVSDAVLADASRLRAELAEASAEVQEAAIEAQRLVLAPDSRDVARAWSQQPEARRGRATSRAPPR